MLDRLLLFFVLLTLVLVLLLCFVIQRLTRVEGIRERRGRLITLLLTGSVILVATAALAGWMQYIEWKRWVIAADLLTGIIFMYTYYRLVRPQTGAPLAVDMIIFLIPVVVSGLWVVYIYYLCMPALVYWKAAFTLTPFLVPLLFLRAYQALTAIPLGFYFVWYYNAFRVPPNAGAENETYMLVEVVLNKTCTDQQRTTIRAKASPGMCWGEWFQLLINDYNQKYPASPVQCFNEQGRAYGWMFYVRPALHLWRRRIDPCASLEENGIEDQCQLVARRVAEQEDNSE